jgi:hypothetical protein
MSKDSAIQTETKYKNPYTRSWILATLLLTPATALILAELGFISLDPILAVIDGFLVALVYVGFRVGYRHFALKSRVRLNRIE